MVVVSASNAWTPTREGIKDRRALVNHLRDDKCLQRYEVSHIPRDLSPYWLQRKWNTWGNRKQKTKAHVSGCSPAAIIRSVFGSYGDQAVAVAQCESGLSVYATNGQYLGLFQMGEYARARYGHSWTALGQSRSAYAYFKDSGSDWSPWQCRPWGLAW